MEECLTKHVMVHVDLTLFWSGKEKAVHGELMEEQKKHG